MESTENQAFYSGELTAKPRQMNSTRLASYEGGEVEDSGEANGISEFKGLSLLK